MTVRYPPAFPQDIRQFAAGYQIISAGLAARFRNAVDGALTLIQAEPCGPDISSRPAPVWKRSSAAATSARSRSSSFMGSPKIVS